MGLLENHILYSLDVQRLGAVCVVGYGNVGRALAMNLRDQGVKVFISGRSPGTYGALRAQKEGFSWIPKRAVAVKGIRVVILTLPDAVMQKNWKRYREAFPMETLLVFAHGWVPWKLGLRNKDGLYGLLAPKGAGSKLRERFERGRGLYMIVDWFGKASPKQQKWAREMVLTLAVGSGGAREGVIHARAEDECRADLMSEQLILCGGLPALITLASQWMKEKGIPPELAWLECVHEARLIAEMIERSGIQGMMDQISTTARFGGLLRGTQIFQALKPMRDQIGEEIDSGAFLDRVSIEEEPERSETFLESGEFTQAPPRDSNRP